MLIPVDEADEIEVKIKVSEEEFNRLKAMMRNHIPADADITLSLNSILSQMSDVYYDNKKGDLAGELRCLCIREELFELLPKKYTLAYKDTSFVTNGIRHNLEYQTDITNKTELHKILLSLGLHILIVVSKERESFSWDVCTGTGIIKIEFDKVAQLGHFIEIEAPNSTIIDGVVKDLNIVGQREAKPYHKILLEKIEKEN